MSVTKAWIAEKLAGIGNAELPGMLHDETIYSWCSRFHRVSCAHDPLQTSSLLFGNPNAGLRHDIPYCMQAFSERTQGQFGDAKALL